MKKFGIIFFISAELVLIFAIGLKILQKNKNVLRTMSVYPIKKETLIFNSTDKLKYFYEPVPNLPEYSADFFPDKVTYNINSDSLNATVNFSIEKPSNVFRIITLGDSFTFGIGVNTIDNWSEQLNNLLNNKCLSKKIEVINLGVEGYDTQYEVERYKLRGQKYKPDLVIWFFIDLIRMDEYVIPLNKKITEQFNKNGEMQKLINKGDFYKAWIEAENNITKQFGVKEIFDFQEKTMEELNNYYNGKLLLVGPPRPIEDEEKNTLKKFSLSRKDIYFFDNLPTVYGVPELSLIDAHPNPKGHQVIANNIFNYLRNNKITSCN